jgi:hypothetical protein
MPTNKTVNALVWLAIAVIVAGITYITITDKKATPLPYNNELIEQPKTIQS